jgi:arginine/lysine/ornithine decarboxylase
MHVRKGYVDMARLDRYVHMYQTSSPSYIMMAGIENCIRYMEEEGQNRMLIFHKHIQKIRKKLTEMKCLQLLTKQVRGMHGVFDYDISKIIISTRKAGMSGTMLADWLRNQYHLELEMSSLDYITAITTLADTREGLNRLCRALLEIDEELIKKNKKLKNSILFLQEIPNTDSRMTIADAMDAKTYQISLSQAEGKISAEFIYAYPPGIPMVAPGELLKKETIAYILNDIEMGVSIQGMKDENAQWIYVVDEKDWSR